MVLILAPDHHLPQTVSVHAASVNTGTDAVGVRIETLAVSFGRLAVLLGHAGSVRVVGDAHAVFPVIHRDGKGGGEVAMPDDEGKEES